MTVRPRPSPSPTLLPPCLAGQEGAGSSSAFCLPRLSSFPGVRTSCRADRPRLESVDACCQSSVSTRSGEDHVLEGLAWAHAAPRGSAPTGGHGVCVWRGRDESPGETRVERAGEWTPGGSPAPLLCPATSWLVMTARLQPPPNSNQKRPLTRGPGCHVCRWSALTHFPTSRVGLLTPICHVQSVGRGD